MEKGTEDTVIYEPGDTDIQAVPSLDFLAKALKTGEQGSYKGGFTLYDGKRDDFKFKVLQSPSCLGDYVVSMLESQGAVPIALSKESEEKSKDSAENQWALYRHPYGLPVLLQFVEDTDEAVKTYKDIRQNQTSPALTGEDLEGLVKMVDDENPLEQGISVDYENHLNRFFYDETQAIEKVFAGVDPLTIKGKRTKRKVNGKTKTVGKSGDARVIKTSDGKHVRKIFRTDKVKSELANRGIIDNLKDILPDFYVESPRAVGYDLNSEGVLVTEYVDGEDFNDKAYEDPVEQMHDVYGDETAEDIRADLRILSNAFGLHDVNVGNFLMTPEKFYVFDMERTGDKMEFNPLLFNRPFSDGKQAGYSVVPEYNSQAFLDKMLKRAGQVQDKKKAILKHYASSLAYAGYSEDEIAEKRDFTSVNIDNLEKNIRAEWNWLKERNLIAASA